MAELSPEARALLAAAAGADDPTDEQRSRADAAARSALALHGVTDLPALHPPRAQPAPGPNAAGPNAAPASATTKLGTAASGWKLALGAAALLAAGWLGTRALRTDPQPVQRSAQQLELSPPQPPPRPIAAAETAVPAAPPALRRPADPTPPLPTLEPMRAEPLDRAVASRQTAGARARAQAATTLQAEVALIASANGLLRAQRFFEAERVLAAHAQRFPRGALREERAALALIARCETGSHAQGRAQRAMQRFLRTAPQSVLAQRVRAACEARPGQAP